MNDDNETPQEVTEVSDDYIVVRNAEQQAMINALVRLRVVCNGSIDVIEKEFSENESLFGQPVRWDEFTCVRAERYLDSDGALGWRCYCAGVSPNAKKLLQYLRDRLANAGYEDVEITPVC